MITNGKWEACIPVSINSTSNNRSDRVKEVNQEAAIAFPLIPLPIIEAICIQLNANADLSFGFH